MSLPAITTEWCSRAQPVGLPVTRCPHICAFGTFQSNVRKPKAHLQILFPCFVGGEQADCTMDLAFCIYTLQSNATLVHQRPADLESEQVHRVAHSHFLQQLCNSIWPGNLEKEKRAMEAENTLLSGLAQHRKIPGSASLSIFLWF